MKTKVFAILHEQHTTTNYTIRVHYENIFTKNIQYQYMCTNIVNTTHGGTLILKITYYTHIQNNILHKMHCICYNNK